MDRLVRIWNIPEQSLDSYSQMNDFITAGNFSPLGDLVVLGLSRG